VHLRQLLSSHFVLQISPAAASSQAACSDKLYPQHDLLLEIFTFSALRFFSVETWSMGTAVLERSITDSLYTKKPGALKSLVIAMHTKTLFYHSYIYCTSTHELAAKYSSVIHLERNLTWSYNYLHKQGVESFLRLQHHSLQLNMYSLFLDLEFNTKKSFAASLSLSLSLSLCLSRSLCLLAQVAYGCLEPRFWYVDGLMFWVGKLTKRKATGRIESQEKEERKKKKAKNFQEML
jgi:hypothetical protein